MPYIQGILTNLEPPEGYDVDFDNPQRQGVPDIYYVTGFGCFISLLFMAQRFYTRLFVDKVLQADDYLLMAGWVTAMGTIGLTAASFSHGYAGVHAWEIPEMSFCMLLVYTYASWTIYIACGALAKLSLLAFYLRLSPQKSFAIAVWTTIAFIMTYTVALIPTLLAGCKFEDGKLGGDDRVTCPSVSMASAILNVISDVAIFILPIPMVLKLQVRTAQKVGLLLIFAIGSATVVTSIVRAAILPAMFRNPDQSWEITYISLWIIIEANLLVICASLPTLRKFFQHAGPKVIGDSWYGSSKSTGTNPSSDRPTITFGGGNAKRILPVRSLNNISPDGGSEEILPIQRFSSERPSEEMIAIPEKAAAHV